MFKVKDTSRNGDSTKEDVNTDDDEASYDDNLESEDVKIDVEKDGRSLEQDTYTYYLVKGEDNKYHVVTLRKQKKSKNPTLLLDSNFSLKCLQSIRK